VIHILTLRDVQRERVIVVERSRWFYCAFQRPTLICEI